MNKDPFGQSESSGSVLCQGMGWGVHPGPMQQGASPATQHFVGMEIQGSLCPTSQLVEVWIFL